MRTLKLIDPLNEYLKIVLWLLPNIKTIKSVKTMKKPAALPQRVGRSACEAA
jgi:hypothetical protein